jgi:hypothetical protein
MKPNAASWDRALRAIAGCGMLLCSLFAPLPLLVRIFAFGGGGLYMLGTAIGGSCLGYRMMGISTCPVDSAAGKARAGR